MSEPGHPVIKFLNNDESDKMSGISTTSLKAVQLTGEWEDNGKMKVSEHWRKCCLYTFTNNNYNNTLMIFAILKILYINRCK